MTKLEALTKLQQYCAYQERCHKEVRSKLLSLKVYGDTLEQVMTELIQEDYLNEERYARSYARGKFRIKGWGKQRITKDLKMRHISDYCIRKAMEEIDEEGGYTEALTEHLEKYVSTRRDKYPPHQLRQKAIQHGVSKGFEMYLVLDTVGELI